MPFGSKSSRCNADDCIHYLWKASCMGGRLLNYLKVFIWARGTDHSVKQDSFAAINDLLWFFIITYVLLFLGLPLCKMAITHSVLPIIDAVCKRAWNWTQISRALAHCVNHKTMCIISATFVLSSFPLRPGWLAKFPDAKGLCSHMNTTFMNRAVFSSLGITSFPLESQERARSKNRCEGWQLRCISISLLIF